MQYRIAMERGFLRADLLERETAEETRRFLRAVVFESIRHGCPRVLVHVRSSKTLFTVERYGVLETFKRLASDPAHRSAVINRNKPRARHWSGARTSAANPRRTAHPTSIRRNPRVFHQPGPLRLIGAYEALERGAPHQDLTPSAATARPGCPSGPRPCLYRRISARACLRTSRWCRGSPSNRRRCCVRRRTGRAGGPRRRNSKSPPGSRAG